MPIPEPQLTEYATLLAASVSVGQKRGVSFPPRLQQPKRALKAILMNYALAIAFCGFSQAGTFLTLSSAGISGGGGGSTAYTASFGTVNALAVNGATVAGVTAAAESNGALYYIPISATLNTQHGNSTVYLTAYVSTNFTHTAALVMYDCPNTGSCSGTSGYSSLSTSSSSPTSIVASPGVASGTNVTIGVALWVPDNNGASAFTGTDAANATITFTVIERKNSNGSLTTIENDTVTFNLPNVTVQDAVQLQLATDTGLTVAPGSDYSMSFGNVNALGINPAPGITTVPAGGGIIYSTNYYYEPAFSDFGSTTATVKVYVSMNFSNPGGVLKLEDASAQAGPYSVIGTSLASSTQITNAASDRSTNARYLGLFISNVNGAGSFQGADNATLTYVLTVP